MTQGIAAKKKKDMWNRFNQPLFPEHRTLKIVLIAAACILIFMSVI